MKTLREYVVTLDSMSRNLRCTLTHMVGCEYPTKGTQPGTTIWWSSARDAERYKAIGSSEKKFSRAPDNIEEWLGVICLRGFTHVSLWGDWMDHWDKRHPIGPELRKVDSPWHDFRSFHWRLYRSATQPWPEAVDIRFENGVPVEAHLDTRYCEYPEWDEPVFGRPSKLEVLRAAAEKRRRARRTN